MNSKISGTPINKKIFFTAYIGNCLETYDYVLLGSLLPKLSEIFIGDFGGKMPLLYGLLAFFAAGLMRPLGSLFFGYIGDKYGRRQALFLTMVGMSVCTLGVALLPSYSQIGMLAPLLFFTFRLGQGFSIGGEGIGNAVYMLESLSYVGEKKIGALYATSNGIGGILALALSMIVSYDIFPEWSWRLLFALGSLIGVFGFILRSMLPDSPAFTLSQKKNQLVSQPMKEVWHSFKTPVCLGVLFVGVAGSLTFLSFTFLSIYLQKIINLPSTEAIGYAALSTLLGTLAVFLSSRILEKIHTDSLPIWGAVFVMISAYPMIVLLSYGTLGIYSAILILAVASGIVCGLLPSYLASLFPTSLRYTGASLSYNIGQAIIGNAYPFYAFWAIDITQNRASPAFLLIILSGAVLILRAFSHVRKYQLLEEWER